MTSRSMSSSFFNYFRSYFQNMRNAEKKAEGWPWVLAGRGQWRRARRLALRSDQGIVRILSWRGRFLAEVCPGFGSDSERSILIGGGLQTWGSDGRKPDSMWNDSQGNLLIPARQRRRWPQSKG